MVILDSSDKKILLLLAKKSSHPSEIGRLLDLPRTTVTFRLARLKRIGKVTSRISGRKTMWSAHYSRLHNKSNFKIYEGENFLECYTIIETLERGATIYVIQGKAAAEGEFRHIPSELMKKIHRVMKSRGIIMRAIANRDILTKIKTVDTSLRKSHQGRIQGVKLVDNTFLSSGELFVTKKYIAIINPTKKSGIIIKDQDIVHLLYDFAKLFFELSGQLETTDINAFIEKI